MTRLLFFLVSVAVSIYILRLPQLHQFILNLNNFELIGAFIAGVFFVMTFTVVPASAVLLTLGETVHPVLLAIIGGFGAMCGDYILMRLFRNETDELIKQVRRKNHFSIEKIFKSRLLAWIGPIIGAIIIASPFPDELGITLLGISKLDTKKFLPLVFILDTMGIFLLVTIGNILF